MFDREGFIEYVGEKSGNSYASGLGRIEKLFSVDIDAEYAKDKCEALLALCLSIRNCIKRAPKSTVPGQHRFGF